MTTYTALTNTTPFHQFNHTQLDITSLQPHGRIEIIIIIIIIFTFIIITC